MKKLTLLLIMCFGILININAQNNCLDFDGDNDYVNCGNASSLDFDASGDYTFSTWLKMPAAPPGPGFFSFLYKATWGNSGYDIRVKVWGGNLHLAFVNPVDGWASSSNAVTFESDTWYHLAVVYSNGDLSFYINGISKGSDSDTYTDNTTNDLKIGIFPPAPFYFKGTIDEVRIWNVARTETQIRDWMYKTENITSEAGLVSVWHLNESTVGAGSAIDSKSGNNGTPTNMTNANCVTSTAPIPYYTAQNGNWNTNATWASGQNAPTNDWANVSIGGHTVTVNSNEGAEDVTITSSGAMTINTGNTLTVTGDLTIESDATGTGSFIDNGTITGSGTAKVQRYITQDIYHYLSSPVSSQAISLLQTGTPHTEFDLFCYDEDYSTGGPAWIDASAQAGNMEVGLGYAYTYNPADLTLEFSGTTNTGTITEDITFSGGDTWYYGWNLVGNPYPSRINATTFINDGSNANIYGTLYFWDEATMGYDDYATWNTSGGVAGGGGHVPNGYIDVGQSFMVHTTTISTSVSFKNDMRVHDAAQFFKDGEIQRFKISIENEEGYYNETLIAFLEGTTNGFDNKYDGFKLKGNPNIALYTKLVEDDGYDYAIQGLPPLTNGVTVKLGLDAGIEGNYAFNVVDIENFHDTTSIFLEDLYENITVNMRKTSEYTFNVNEPGSITDRFFLHFNTSALGIDDNENINDRINVYTYDNIICVENYNPFGDIYVEVYNTLGQQLVSRKLNNQQKNEITLNAGRGIYIVRVVCEEKVYSAKVYLGD